MRLSFGFALMAIAAVNAGPLNVPRSPALVSSVVVGNTLTPSSALQLNSFITQTISTTSTFIQNSDPFTARFMLESLYVQLSTVVANYQKPCACQGLVQSNEFIVTFTGIFAQYQRLLQIVTNRWSNDHSLYPLLAQFQDIFNGLFSFASSYHITFPSSTFNFINPAVWTPIQYNPIEFGTQHGAIVTGGSRSHDGGPVVSSPASVGGPVRAAPTAAAVVGSGKNTTMLNNMNGTNSIATHKNATRLPAHPVSSDHPASPATPVGTVNATA